MRIRILILLITIAGCTLFENKRGDDDVPGDGSGSGSGSGSGPIGRTFFVSRSITDMGSCPAFDIAEQSHSIDVMTSTVFVNSQLAANAVVRSPPAREGSDPPNVSFSLFESWNSSEGSASPTVNFQLFIDGSLVTGKASSSFVFQSVETGSTACFFQFNLSGS